MRSCSEYVRPNYRGSQSKFLEMSAGVSSCGKDRPHWLARQISDAGTRSGSRTRGLREFDLEFDSRGGPEKAMMAKTGSQATLSGVFVVIRQECISTLS